MSYAGLERVATAIGVQAESNDDAQITTAWFVINMVLADAALQNNWMKILKEDAEEIFDAALQPEHPEKVAIAQAQKEMHSSQSDQETSIVETLIAGQKSEAEMLGTNMKNTYELEEPVNQFMEFITGSLRRY